MNNSKRAALSVTLFVLVALPVLVFLAYVIVDPSPGRQPRRQPIQAAIQEAQPTSLDFSLVGLSHSVVGSTAVYAGEIRNDSGRFWRLLSLNLTVFTETGGLFDVVKITLHDVAPGEIRAFSEIGFKAPPAAIRGRVSYDYGEL